MRQSLGTAVFSGMLGVTLFGIFLTPVFFYVIQGVGETQMFAGADRAVDRLDRLLGGGPGHGARVTCSASWAWFAVLVGGDCRRLRRRACWCWQCAACIRTIVESRTPQYQSVESSDEPVANRRLELCPRGRVYARAMVWRVNGGLRCVFTFLHRSADLRHGDFRGHHAGRRRGRVHVAGRPVSRGDAADGAGDGHLSGGQRPDACATPWRPRSRSRSAASRA